MGFIVLEGRAERRAPLFNAIVLSLLLHGFGFLPGVIVPAHLTALPTSKELLQVTLSTQLDASDGRVKSASEKSELTGVTDGLSDSSRQEKKASSSAPDSGKEIGGVSGAPRKESLVEGPVNNAPEMKEYFPNLGEYRADGLEPPPRLLSDIDLVYPESAGLREGRVVVRILINERGIVDQVTVTQAFPQGVFDEAAMAAFRNALFSPGKFVGLPVKSQLSIEVEFLPTNRGANVSGKGY